MKRAIFFEVKRCYRIYMWPIFREMERRGYKCYFAGPKTRRSKWYCDYGFVWNGHDHRVSKFNRYLKESGIPHSFIESGYFSQLNHSFVSRAGSIGRFLFLDEKIEDPTGEDMDLVQRKSSSYVPGYTYKYLGHIAGMLQLQKDTSIKTQSDFKDSQEFVDRVESDHPNDNVIFRPHPYERNVRLRTSSPLSRSRTMWDHVLPARKVVGINSTSLYESVLAGKEVVAYGDCALSRNPDNHIGVVAEIIKREIHVDADRCGDQLERSLGDEAPR